MTMIAKAGLAIALALTLLLAGVAASTEAEGKPTAARLTAGNIDDNLEFAEYTAYQNRAVGELADPSLPSPDLTDRVVVEVKDSNGNPFPGAMVRVGNAQLPAGSNGRLYVYPGLDGVPANDVSLWNLQARAPEGHCAVPHDCTKEYALREQEPWGTTLEMTIPQPSSLPTQLDLALILATTSSMHDEVAYLQAEFANVVRSAIAQAGGGTKDIHVRVAIVMYRDNVSRGVDDYMVTTQDFQALPQAMVTLEYLAECGDDRHGYDEDDTAMEEALVQTNGLRWRSGNVARVALLVTDAPPRSSNLQAALEASLGLRQNGVRLYGLAAGGASPKAEYVLRLVSLLTGARYAWLTGNGNNNPWHTWLTGTEQGNNPYGCHEITALDRLLVRVLAAELLGKRIEEGGGQQDGGVCSWLGGVCSWLGTASSTHPNCSTSEEEGNSGTDVGPTTTVPGGE